MVSHYSSFDMKRIFLLIFPLFVLTFGANRIVAQEVTKFLGIPVDGPKEEMLEKIAAKGFRYHDGIEDALVGEFNGQDVLITVATQRGKVWRVGVLENAKRSASQARLRFNKLVSQFERNPRYESLEEAQTIPDDEDIAHEMLVNKKEYRANFYQSSAYLSSQDTVYMRSEIFKRMETNPIEYAALSEEEQEKLQMKLALVELYEMAHRSVWFKIENLGRINEYYLLLYYDSKHNEADGEDL